MDINRVDTKINNPKMFSSSFDFKKTVDKLSLSIVEMEEVIKII